MKVVCILVPSDDVSDVKQQELSVVDVDRNCAWLYASRTNLELIQLKHYHEKLLDNPRALLSHSLSVSDDISER